MITRRRRFLGFFWVASLLLVISICQLSRAADDDASPADLILHNGRIVTMDGERTVHSAVAIRGGRILKLGADKDVLPLKGASTAVRNLEGRMVIPGLIDSHVHPVGAAMHEFDHEIPPLLTIADVLNYVRARAKTLGPGKWIEIRQVFITRLKEQRYPTRQELDEAAPENPVLFATGPDASINSLAMKLSGIDRNFKVSGHGFAEKDAAGEPTGILRSCTSHVKVVSSSKSASETQRLDRLAALMDDYAANGITAIADRGASTGGITQYRKLLAQDRLPVRVFASRLLDGGGSLDSIRENIASVARERDELKESLEEAKIADAHSRLRIIGIKMYLDGGMLTGSAYLLEPWGVSSKYGITDAAYRGTLFLQPEKLEAIVEAAAAAGLQYTAHSVGDGAVTNLLAAYEAVNKRQPLGKVRPCVTHANFQTADTIIKAAELGAVMDIQPVWLYSDGKTLLDHFGQTRLRYFQPLKSLAAAGVIVGGGSDHMQKIGSMRSVNLYNPFLGMQTTITRIPEHLDASLHPEESLDRNQALAMYTRNNAHLLFSEDSIGSLEVGKLADLVIVDRDLLDCPATEIGGTRVIATYVGGRQVWPKSSPAK